MPEGAAYYYDEDRGWRENWDNHAVSWSELSWIDFQPTELVRELTAPYLVITGENAWSRSGAEQLYENAASEIKELRVVDGAGHFDMYDLEPYVREAMGCILDFLNTNLNAGSENAANVVSEYTERRPGSSETTLATPDDFPEAYNYGDGLAQSWAGGMNDLRLPEPNGNATVMNTAPDTSRIQALYLWKEGNVPAVTDFTPDMTGYFDEYDFGPTSRQYPCARA